MQHHFRFLHRQQSGSAVLRFALLVPSAAVRRCNPACNYRFLLAGLTMLFLLYGGAVLAQPGGGFPGQGSGGGPSVSVDSIEQVTADTSWLYRYYPLSLHREYNFQDSALSNQFHMSDPVRRRRLDYRNLGIDGSPHTPIVYEPAFRKGVHIGFDQYPLYHLDLDSLAFYRLNLPYTQADFRQNAVQGNALFRARFSSNFANGVNFTIDYRRITMIQDNLQFANQQNRTTALGFGLAIQPPDSRYRAFLGVVTNRTEQDENGGVEEIIDFTEPTSNEVFLESARTRQDKDGIYYLQYFDLRRAQKPPPATPATAVPDSLLRTAVDTTAQKERDTLQQQTGTAARARSAQVFRLRHQIKYESEQYRFFDENPSLASAYYGDFLTDERGLRQAIRHRAVSNRFHLVTYRPEQTPADAARRSRGLLELGLSHKLSWINEEAVDTTVNNLFVDGRIQLEPATGLQLVTYGHFGLLDNAGDYRVQGTLSFRVPKLGAVSATLINQLYRPSLIQERLFVSQRQVWNNDFDRTLATTVSGSLRVKDWQLNVTVAYHLLNNFIYYNTQARPDQSSTAVNVGQLIVEKDFQLGSFHFDNIVALQQSSADVLRLPTVFGKHSLYWQGPVFQVLQTRLGADLRYNSAYFSETYQPILGNFHLQNQQEVAFFPALDAYVNIRVTKFRFYAKLKTLSNLFLSEQLYYQTAFYPEPPSSGFRLGLSWRFTN